jgi:hypothetical protein
VNARPPDPAAGPTGPCPVTTVFSLFAQAAERRPGAPAYVDRAGVVVSYHDLFLITTLLAELIKEPHP